MNVDYFRYLALADNFLNFRLCEIQFGAQCLLGEHGPLSIIIWQGSLEVNPRVLIGSFLVGILPYGPFPWKRS